MGSRFACWLDRARSYRCRHRRWRHGHSQLAFDEIRVSNIARSRDELGYFATEPLKPDRYTTLLINFDDGTATPLFSATSAAAASRPLPAAGARLIEGKFGQALSFSKETR